MPTVFIRELRKLPPVRAAYRTASKHTQIRERIETCVHGMEPGSRLPPLRELSTLLGATPPTVWRAVGALVKDGVLRTREKSGIFVGRGAASATPAPNGAGEGAAVKTLSLAADALLPHQRRFWQETFDAFHREHRSIRLASRESPLRPADGSPYGDLAVEHLPRHTESRLSEEGLLDLEALMGPEATRPFRGPALPERARRFVPFQLTVPCLFINLKWMEAHALGRPKLDGFAPQMAFVDACVERMHQSGAPRSRLIIQQPLLWLGREALTVFALAAGQGRQAGRAGLDRLALARVTERALHAWQALEAIQHGVPHAPPPMVKDFIAGHSPLYFGFSYEIGLVEAAQPAFPWQVLPSFAVDDGIPVTVQCLTADARTPYPIECVRFIEHAISADSQERLADCSLVPLDARRLRVAASPGATGWAPEWRSLRERMALIYLADEHGDYVYGNIMADDLYRCVDGGVSIELALESMLRHTRAYLNHRWGMVPGCPSA